MGGMSIRKFYNEFRAALARDWDDPPNNPEKLIMSDASDVVADVTRQLMLIGFVDKERPHNLTFNGLRSLLGLLVCYSDTIGCPDEIGTVFEFVSEDHNRQVQTLRKQRMDVESK